MVSYVAQAVAPDEESALLLANAVDQLGPTGIGACEIEDGGENWEVTGYFAEPPDSVALALLAAAFGAGDFTVSRAPERDWAAHARRQLTPIEMGRFVAFGGHDRERITDNRLGLQIEAAMAFGTGHHGTTEGCLKALDWLDRARFRPRRVADIGCGTAVLAMGAAKLWPARIWASDVDLAAIKASVENVRVNNLAARISVFQAVGLKHARYREVGALDLILANILARPLKRLAPEIAAQTAPGGVVVLSGLLDRQRQGGAERLSGMALRA